MTSIDDVTPELLAEYASKFFRLINGHGEFRLCQLEEYCSLQLRVRLRDAHKSWLLGIAEKAGAKRDKALPDLMRLPVKRRQGLPGRKRDKATIDMFGEMRKPGKGRKAAGG